MKTLNEHIKKQLLEDESLKYALATNLAKYGRPQSKKSDKPSKLTKGLEKKREKNVKDLKKAGLEEHDYGRYDSQANELENKVQQIASQYNPSVSMGYYSEGRPDNDPRKDKGYGEVQFIEKNDVDDITFNKVKDLLKNQGFEITSEDKFYDYDPGERDYYPKIKFEFHTSQLKEVTKPYGEKYQEKLSKLKGKKVKYYGKVYQVVDADEYILSLKDEDGRISKINLNQFTQKGMVDEKKKKRDRCLKIADRKFEKPSAYKSGAVVRCRKGDIWKGIKESVNTLDEKKKETLRTWFGRKGAPGKTGGWVDCNSPIRKDGKVTGYKPCGRQKGEKRAKYPSCRPTPAGCKDKGKGKSWGKTK